MFQFLIVQLKDAWLQGFDTRQTFQFLIVQLKGMRPKPVFRDVEFQFLIVQLKVIYEACNIYTFRSFNSL